MKVRLVGSCIGTGTPHQFAMSYVVNDTIAIDAGCIGLLTPLEAQSQIRHVFLSHPHMDHIASLPSFLDNVFRPGDDGVAVYANQFTLDCLRRDVFNDRLWPDLVRLSAEESPFFRLVTIESGQETQIGSIRVTSVALDHAVPTLGFVVEDNDSAVAFISDTAPTDEIFRVANSKPHLKAVFLEASFPNSLDWLARKAHHLTPAMFRAEAQKLTRPVQLIAVHAKPAFQSQILAELAALDLPQIETGFSDQYYHF